MLAGIIHFSLHPLHHTHTII